MRWRDREMWVDVGERTIVTTLEALWPEALAILHFLLRKTTWKQAHDGEGFHSSADTELLFTVNTSRQTCSQAHAHEYTTTWMHVQDQRQSKNSPFTETKSVDPVFLRIPLEVLRKCVECTAMLTARWDCTGQFKEESWFQLETKSNSLFYVKTCSNFGRS